ncbi:MAG: hypothetical protein LBE35_08465, partial [Clostridiales bacterium]|nr:hypothetical protein [Clostridiales bacterium]
MSNMVVRTNILALNSHRNLGLVGNNQARASARLSSGFRINSAADDAAGLAISEGMRAQIRGMNQAARNTQDGISLIQTAEGYLSTITELLQRARELIVQAANDTYSIDNRTTIQNEIYQLMEEIDRIADTATFNQMILFDGSIAFRQLSAQVITETLQNRNFFRGEPSAEQVQALMDWINSDSARNFVMNGSGDALEIMNGALEPLLAQFSDTPIVWDPGRSTTQFMQILIDPTSDVRDVHGQRLFDQIFWDQMDEYVRTSTRSDFHITTGVNFNGINHMLETVESAQVALRFWYAFSNQDAAGNWALNVERDELGQRFRV